MQEMQRMMALSANPDLATDFTQLQALEYEQQKKSSSAIEPEIVELAHHYNLSERHSRLLHEQMKQRNNTFDEDIAAMYEILKGAKNPADLLMVSIRWMNEGVFRGTLTPNPEVEKVAKKFKLDPPSACKLAEILEGREAASQDLKKMESHLERSNRPSALVMMMLKDLKQGKAIEEATKQPSIGSWMHNEEIKEQQRKADRAKRDRRDRERGRSQDRDRRGRSRSRDRRDKDRGRDRDRDRDKSRSRERRKRSAS